MLQVRRRRARMTRFFISRRLRLAFISGAVLTLLLAFRFESDYRYRLNHLPSLVDEHGNTASLEAAMSGVDSYEHAKQIRRFGLVSFGAGVFLCACATITKSRRDESHVDQQNRWSQRRLVPSVYRGVAGCPESSPQRGSALTLDTSRALA